MVKITQIIFSLFPMLMLISNNISIFFKIEKNLFTEQLEIEQEKTIIIAKSV